MVVIIFKKSFKPIFFGNSIKFTNSDATGNCTYNRDNSKQLAYTPSLFIKAVILTKPRTSECKSCDIISLCSVSKEYISVSSIHNYIANDGFYLFKGMNNYRVRFFIVIRYFLSIRKLCLTIHTYNILNLLFSQMKFSCLCKVMRN